MYTVIVSVCDNYNQPLCALESFVITVEEVPVAPVAVDDAYSMDENTTLVVEAPGVLENDFDPRQHDPGGFVAGRGVDR